MEPNQESPTPEQPSARLPHETEIPSSPPLGFGTRLGLLFTAPSKLGDEIREHPSWFTPLFLGMILALLGMAAIPADIFVEANRAAAAASGSAQEMPEFMEGSFFKYAGMGALTLGWFIMNLISAGLISLVFAFILGDEGRFKQYLAAAAWASVIAGMAALLISPLRVMTRDPQLTLGVGTFVDLVMDGGYFLRLSKMLDFFALWSWAVLGILASRFDRQRSAASGIAVIMIMMLSILGVVAIFIPDT